MLNSSGSASVFVIAGEATKKAAAPRHLGSSLRESVWPRFRKPAGRVGGGVTRTSKAGVGAVLALALLAVLAYERGGDNTGHSAVPAKVQKVAVETVPVSRTSMPDRVTSYGNLVPLRSVNIVPEEAGQVEKIFFADGQRVAA